VYLLALLVRVASLCVFVGAVSASFEFICICWRVGASSEFICICSHC
jgi:hypothetical protein